MARADGSAFYNVQRRRYVVLCDKGKMLDERYRLIFKGKKFEIKSGCFSSILLREK